jgi:glycosyltransferase involved in cell wall biosynthesis
MKIVRACLSSMRKHAGMDCNILIWDNGSCDELNQWMEQEYKPDYLVFSPNIGKDSARAAILNIFPEETIIGISDDDMLFYPGWLDEQVKILKHFPNVGVVSGYPCRAMMQNNENTLKWAKENGCTIKEGRFIPNEWEFDYAVSVQENPIDWIYYTKQRQDTIIEYQGMQAYATSHHCQAVHVAGRVRGLAKWDGRSISNEKPWDQSIDKAGMLRLATVQRLSRHMGNVIDPKLEEELTEMKLL